MRDGGRVRADDGGGWSGSEEKGDCQVRVIVGLVLAHCVALGRQY